ncbi:MAG: 3-hydroxyacyl-CoA dehydrogenase family protein [Chitinophagales bacterium]
MKIAVLANTTLKEELAMQGIKDGTELLWPSDITELSSYANIHACIDLLFENESQRIQQLKNLKADLIFINSVITTGKALPENFIRINGWPTFLKRPITETSIKNEKLKPKAEEAFSFFHKKLEWTPDIPGFITARVIAMIINEAYFTLEEKVSTKEEIDLAMKMGTNYPYGPFEWSKKIGLKNIYDLLIELNKTNSRYEPAALLKKEAFL